LIQENTLGLGLFEEKSASDEKGISLPPRCTLDISEVIY
jgi:hypothetical protein